MSVSDHIHVRKLWPLLAAPLVALLIVALVTSGGGTPQGAPSSAPSVSATPTPTPTPIATVEDLATAAIAAGYSCPTFTRDTDATYAESGDCEGQNDYLFLPDDGELPTAVVEKYKADPTWDLAVLYGENWIIVNQSESALLSIKDELNATLWVNRAPAPEPTPTQVQPTVTLHECYDTDYEDLESEIVISNLGSPDAEFAEIWPMKVLDCYKAKRTKGPLTTREQKALALTGYKVKDVAHLYQYCAENDDDDYYAKKSSKLNDGQASEIKGWLVLCPKHPLAKKWKAAIKRGEKEQKLQKDGRSFYAGTYRVGKDVKPGTYAVKGNIENCYWERQNRNGDTIDNGFVLNAKRVQVTIRSSDYAFSSEGCGNWRQVQ